MVFYSFFPADGLFFPMYGFLYVGDIFTLRLRWVIDWSFWKCSLLIRRQILDDRWARQYWNRQTSLQVLIAILWHHSNSRLTSLGKWSADLGGLVRITYVKSDWGERRSTFDEIWHLLSREIGQLVGYLAIGGREMLHSGSNLHSRPDLWVVRGRYREKKLFWHIDSQFKHVMFTHISAWQ